MFDDITQPRTVSASIPSWRFQTDSHGSHALKLFLRLLQVARNVKKRVHARDIYIFAMNRSILSGSDVCPYSKTRQPCRITQCLLVPEKKFPQKFTSVFYSKNKHFGDFAIFEVFFHVNRTHTHGFSILVTLVRKRTRSWR